MSEQMLAIEIEKPGGPEVLRAVRVPVPEPRADEVLIKVAAAGVNRPDCLQRAGHYPVPADASPLPGLEVAGEVVAAGDHVDRWRVGDKVVALTHGGGYAEFCSAHEGHCLPWPDGLDAVSAAALPETCFTVHYNVFTRARLDAGEWLLVHGGSSGIGTTAIQLAAAAGAKVITTAGSEEKCRFCETLGAARAINYKTEEWPRIVREATDGYGVDVVLDMVAGPYVSENLEVLAPDGRYAMIASPIGRTEKPYRSSRRGRGLASRPGRKTAIRDPRSVRIGTGRGRARADGKRPAYRQDRLAHRLLTPTFHEGGRCVKQAVRPRWGLRPWAPQGAQVPNRAGARTGVQNPA
jgi:NADPH2:quinone reductase